MESDNQVFFAFLFTTIAGISTGIGGLVSFIKYARKEKFLAFSLGLSAGAMLYISFVELILKSINNLSEQLGSETAYSRVAILFIGGLLASAIIARGMDFLMDKFGILKVPMVENTEDVQRSPKKTKKLYKAGLVTAVALAIHNLPEGLITFLTSMQDLQLGLGITIAIAIHNIPEGLAVAMPIYHATQNKTKAFLISLLSGLSEPFGALIAYFLFFKYLDQELLATVNVLVASIMVYVASFELIPSAYEMGYKTHTKWGMIAGIGIMGISLVLLS
ncbi:MAG: zinc transporter ZupT [Lunatimonas sp.]|uniref:zinc transporter ZupT n=1 Tax=Lunatimonas sp. TaxID=2060141 RepID=UPI00263B58FC|nr:zinc transporter ZupT [Lunatimonas sp.]MCC5935889.1 zinc transporter ZupT [Lunatimonas sp.]